MKDKKDNDFEVDYEEMLRKEKAFEENMTYAICSIGFSAATTSIISLITGCIDKPETLPYFIAGGVVLTPIMFILAKRLRKKMDDKFRKDMLTADNLFSMIGEFTKQDRIIDETTSLFLNELSLQLEANKIDLSGEDMISLNKLLFLVNANYFDRITEYLPSITREKLIDHIIKQAVIYYKNTDRRKFDETDAEKIISYCLLIKPEIKKEITQEFKDSKVKLGNMIDYAIERKDKPYNENDYLFVNRNLDSNDSSGYNFDITSESDLHTLIVSACDNEYYQEFGNPHALDWDMDFLKRILTLIAANHRQELIEIHPDYSNLSLASSFITNAITYALVNNRQEVGQRELLSTFKNWHYMPFSMQDEVLTKLFEEDGIDYSLHPYRVRKDPAYTKRAQIIQIKDHFFRKKQTTEE